MLKFELIISKHLRSFSSFGNMRSMSTHLRKSQISDLIFQLRSKNGASYEKSNHVLKYLESSTPNWDLWGAYLQNLERSSPELRLEDLLDILERVQLVSGIRFKAELMNSLRNITLNLTGHGVSSFSLDGILRYAKLCETFRIYPASIFIDAVCLRVSQVSDSDDVELEMAKYLIDLNSVWSRQSLQDRIDRLSDAVLAQLPLKYVSRLEGERLDTLMSVHANRPTDELLLELQTTPSSSAVFQNIAKVCDERVIDDPTLICMYLKTCTRRSLPERDFNELFEIALQEKNLLPELLNSISNISKVDQVVAMKIIEILSDEISQYDFHTFMNVLECLAVLNIHSIELVGLAMKRAEEAIKKTHSEQYWWKLSVWWNFVQEQLAEDSIIPDVAKKQFPNVFAALPHMCQSRISLNLTRLGSCLKNAQITHTINPVVRHSPLRAHAMVVLPDSQMCYIFLTRENGKLIQTCKDSRISIAIIKKFVQAADAKLCLIPKNLILGENVDIVDIVHSHIV